MIVIAGGRCLTRGRNTFQQPKQQGKGDQIEQRGFFLQRQGLMRGVHRIPSMLVPG